jgi:hypothetical protein
MNYTSVAHCGNDHQEWIKAIDFYEDDLDLLEGRLVEIVKKNNVHDAMAGVEHFQNQFIVQRNNIDELRHSIREHDGWVAGEAKEHAGRMDSRHNGEHAQLKDQVDSFGKIFNELRHEFNIFLAKWM